MLKAHTYFQIFKNNSGPHCKRCFAQSDMLEKIFAKLVSRILRKRLTFCPIEHVGKNTCETCTPDFT